MPTATIVTNQGSFTVSLMPEHAPETVENFMALANGTKEFLHLRRWRLVEDVSKNLRQHRPHSGHRRRLAT